MTRTRFQITVLLAMTVLVLPQIVSGQTQTSKPQVTFTKDVAPIFQEKCEACHRPDSIAPMSLVTYEEARPWAQSIKARVAARADAAVAHRQDRRHPAVQERSIAQRRADRHDRAVGRRRRAARRPEGHAAAEAVAGRRRLELCAIRSADRRI